MLRQVGEEWDTLVSSKAKRDCLEERIRLYLPFFLRVGYNYGQEQWTLPLELRDASVVQSQSRNRGTLAQVLCNLWDFLGLSWEVGGLWGPVSHKTEINEGMSTQGCWLRIPFLECLIVPITMSRDYPRQYLPFLEDNVCFQLTILQMSRSFIKKPESNTDLKLEKYIHD